MVELVILHICFSSLVDINVENFGTNSLINYLAECFNMILFDLFTVSSCYMF